MNILGEFCGIRDVPELTPEALKRRFGIRQADVMVLFGGSILCGGDVLAAAMKVHVAKKICDCRRRRPYNRNFKSKNARGIS